MKKYQVWAYSGVMWLFDLGQFDTFDEASNALCDECARQAESVEPEYIEDFEELFFFESRIEEINSDEEK
jgi:hypothetical protein